jgi:2-dehydropantoate 2-reductase
MSESVKVLVVGAGGVGAYFGGRLAQAGADVSVICRSDYEHVKNDGFTIESHVGDFTFKPAGVYKSCAEYPGKADYLIVTTKVLPEIDVVDLIRPAVSSKTSIVLIQNGIDIEQPIAEAFPDNEIISGIAYIGVFRMGQGNIRHQAAGTLKFGVYPEGDSENLDNLVALFNAANVECNAVDDIVLYRWIKLVWNVPYNPVSVLAGGVDTKVISNSPLLEGLCEKLMEEVCAVAEAYGKKMPEDIVLRNLEYTRGFPPYKTSMLLDWENGRQLEVEAIVGNVVRAANAKNIDVPHLETIYALLKGVNATQK